MITKLRASQITLDLPTENSDVWVRAVLQKVIKDDDYQTVQTVDRVGAVHRQFSDFAASMLTFFDPLQGKEITLSGAALGMAVAEFIKQWMLADVPDASLNQHGDIIKE